MTMANLDNNVKPKLPSPRVLRAIWRNRRRFPQNKMTVDSTFKDKKGTEYIRFSNGMIARKQNKE